MSVKYYTFGGYIYVTWPIPNSTQRNVLFLTGPYAGRTFRWTIGRNDSPVRVKGFAALKTKKKALHD